MSEEKKEPKTDCPFCGSNSINMEIHQTMPNHGNYFVVCKTCYCEGPQGSTQEEAIKHWDTRQEPVITEALEVLDVLIDCVKTQEAVCVHRPPLSEKIKTLATKIRSTLQGESKPETETAKTRLLKLGETIPDTYRREVQAATAIRAEQWYAGITIKEAHGLANKYELKLPHNGNTRKHFIERVTLLYMVR